MLNNYRNIKKNLQVWCWNGHTDGTVYCIKTEGLKTLLRSSFNYTETRTLFVCYLTACNQSFFFLLPLVPRLDRNRREEKARKRVIKYAVKSSSTSGVVKISLLSELQTYHPPGNTNSFLIPTDISWDIRKYLNTGRLDELTRMSRKLLWFFCQL